VSQSVEAFKNAFKIPELKQRIIFTLLMLSVYRLGAWVPAPGINGKALSERMGEGGIFGFLDLFSGGAFSNATIFALGIMPYISSSIIMQLLVYVVPAFEQLRKMGAEGQKKITEYTRYGTIILCVVQSLGFAGMLVGYNQPGQATVVPNTGITFYLLCIVTFTTGTAFLMWLGEQISERGVGNGVSLIIFTSIAASMPPAVFRMIGMIQDNELSVFSAGLLVCCLVVIVGLVIYVTTAQRRVPVQYPRQVRGRKVTQGGRNYLPLRVNQAGVIPIIFASSILMLPGMLANAIQAEWVQIVFNDWLGYGSAGYLVLYAMLIIFFTFFYAAVSFNPIEIADNLKKNGGVITGVRPGKATAEHLNFLMTRITLVGALFLAGVALIPELVYQVIGLFDYSISSLFGGTSLLILVGVALDTMRQIEQHLIMRNYDGFFGGGGRRVRGRRA
jgi:preprotein translocase subunit SecY